MKIKFKQRNRMLFELIGQHIRRHSVLLIVFLSILIVGNIGFSFGWYYSPDEVDEFTEVAFYISQSVLLTVSVGAMIFIILAKFNKFSDFSLAILTHIFATFLVAWGTVAFCLDLSLGFSPLLYLLVIAFVAGIFVVDPFYFIGLEVLSLIPISISIAIKSEIFFGGKYVIENIFLFVFFLMITGVICFRNHHIIYRGYKLQRKLEELSYNDELTGLLNERSYVNEVENINHRIDNGEDVKFAVILMDVNNLKVTNDTYGHRYGCSLIVRCGHTLPKLFKSSKLFHVGGDEFIAFVYGEDFDNFEETMKRFDEAMLYSIVEYEGKQLIFSVARGYHIREEGQYYKDVLQIADKAMYENKKYLKEKYNMKSR